MSVVALDEGEAEIDPRRDPGRRPDAPVPHVDALVDDAGLGKARLQSIQRRPVRGGAAAIEQPRFPERERARADGGDGVDAARVFAQPGRDREVLGGGGGERRAPRDDDRVWWARDAPG